jgi:hypothetical protein
MKKELLLALSVLGVTNSSASIKADESVSKVPGFKLQINEESYFSDKLGVVSPEQVANAQIGRLVKIYRTDGFCYEGRITEIEESKEYLKVYGVISNVKDSHFGFVMVKGGIFAGALIEEKGLKTYVLEFSKEYNGYILMLSHKYDKPAA